MKQRYVGVLVNDSMFRGIARGRTFHENISFYEAGGKQYGVTPIFFRLQDVNMNHETVNALVMDNGAYKRRTLSLPRIIHNRALYFRSRSARGKLEALVTNKGRVIFNRWNRYSKWHVHQLLMESPELRPHLPETVKASKASIHALGRKHQAVIVKPVSSSIGRGIMKVERTGTRWKLSYPQSKRRGRTLWRTIQYRLKSPTVLSQSIRRKPYIAQQRLNLATCNGNPFDMRVSVQRGSDGVFQLTGIAVKVAKRHAFVTNVAQGGSVYRLEDALQDYSHLQPQIVRESVGAFALSAANHLSGKLPSLSDIGFDIGITPDATPVFIEMNLRDLRYSFQEGGMHEEWKRTYTNPMGYARYLLDGNKPGPQ